MGDISKGFAFSGTSPNNQVTAANLNNLVDLSTVQPTLISGKPVKSSPGSNDSVLILDSATQTLQQTTVQNLVPQYAQRSSFSGLKIYTILSNAQLMIGASQIVMLAATGTPRYVSAFLSQLDPFGVFGAGGRDQSGAFSANSWFYVWAISTGAFDSVLASVSPTSPTLPSGYIYKCLLGAWRIPNTGTVLVSGLQLQNRVNVDIGADATDTTSTAQVPQIGGATFTAKQINSTKDTLTVVDISKCVPLAIVSRVRGLIGTSGGSAGTTAVAYAIAPNADSSTHIMTGTGASIVSPNYGMSMVQIPATASVGTDAYLGFTTWAPFEVSPNLTLTYNIYVACDNTAARNTMRITGYDLDL